MNVNDDSEKHKPKSMANLYPVLIALSFFCFLIKSAAVSSNATRGISVNCGSTGTSAARSGRVWIGDVWPEYPYLLQVKGASTISAVVGNSISADPIPYKRARISQSQFFYTFLVMPGQNIIRLHFNPTKYRGFQGLKDLFTVEAGPFTLLSNFSPSLTADALGVGFFVKEFLLNIPEYEKLNIIFSPEISESLDTYAFVNGIEIFSVPPSSVSYFQDGDYSTALEILEVKQISVPYAGDSGYAHPFPFSISQNAKYNTWKIPVDVGFKYLVRVHFLEKGLKFALAGAGNGIPPYRDYTVMMRGNTDEGKRDILIPLQSYDDLIDVMFKDIAKEMVADFNGQLVRGSDGNNNIRSYSDSMVMVTEKGERDMFIRLQPYDSLIDAHALVSGVEIFKVINSYNSVWNSRYENRFFLAPLHMSSTNSFLVFTTISILQVIIVLELWKTRKPVITEKKNNFFEKIKRWKSSSFQQQSQETREASISDKENKPKSSSGAERLCRPFSLDEIQLATNNFSDALLIGRGGYGNVYKGHIDEEQYTVAVKRLKSSSKQGESEFWTEIETLSELRHVNIVSLIGYCNEHGEMILVYEYVPCGTLADHLYKLARKSNSCSTLTWKQRLDICIGAGRGLDYLHTGCGVIHRDVKAANILLDENFVAKVSDFGLAKLENISKSQSYVSTLVKGTFGYLDPSYFLTGQLTRKTDTYGFGVVLLEVLCGRPAIDTMAAEGENGLSKWARDKINKGEVEQIISESLREEISPNSLETYLGVVERCLHDEPKKRPTMSQVVVQLELAVEQQETKQVPVLNEIARVSSDKTKSSPRANCLCHRFSLDEIQLATNNFSDALLIGSGNDGEVYKGRVDEEKYTVSVKRLKSSSCEGENEFWTEIETLSELRHVNIVYLIGYCNELGERILVYEYVPCGTLADHLYKLATESNSFSPLTWTQRLDICIGAGRGLDYLHTDHGIIHRDVKALNILLDENLVAKVSNFGLAKHENRSELQSYVSTGVMGTVWYLDPSYFITGQLTRKSDTYGFGLVLLEVLCGRPAIDTMAAKDEKILSRWAQDKINKGEVEEIISESLREEISPNSLKTFLKVVERCLHDEPKKRPTMSEVVSQLELAVEQQETKQVSALNQIARVSNDNHHPDEYVVDPDEYVVDDPLFIRTKEDEGQNKIYSHEGNLKECVLFCSVFPSGYEFTKNMLVWQWVAKSLINLSEDEIEEVYIQCFDKLLNLDYIVPSGYCHFADEVKYKVGHDMTMFLQNQLLEPKFQNNLEGKQRSMVKVENLSLAFKEIDLINFGILKQCTRLQTLIIHRCYGSKVNYLPPDLFLELKALKILNLSHTNIKELPSSVENLEEVRYLDMSETPIKWLPESILCLGHLQTLKLDGCLSLVGLPKCTSNLINLRHLVLDIARQLQSMPTGIGNLSKLRTLGAFLVGEEDGTRIGELKNMNSLRGSLRLLNLENVPTKEEAAEAYLCNKHGLKKIELQWSDLQDEKNPNEEEILNSIQPPLGIQELKILFYSGGGFPSWISNPSFSELVNITLYRCRYCDTLPSLGELPSLKLLNIIENNEVKEINSFFCRKESSEHHVAFPKLEKLSFDSMSELEQWTGFKEGDFPCLSYLIIQYCPKLIGISFLSHLSSLGHLEISYCPKITCLPEGGLPLTLESLMIKDCPKLKERCCNKQCEDWSKVARVPAFYIDNEKVSV